MDYIKFWTIYLNQSNLLIFIIKYFNNFIMPCNTIRVDKMNVITFHIFNCTLIRLLLLNFQLIKNLTFLFIRITSFTFSQDFNESCVCLFIQLHLKEILFILWAIIQFKKAFESIISNFSNRLHLKIWIFDESILVSYFYEKLLLLNLFIFTYSPYLYCV